MDFIVGPYPSQARLKFEFILGLFDLLLLTQYQLVILGINDDFWKHHSKVNLIVTKTDSSVLRRK